MCIPVCICMWFGAWVMTDDSDDRNGKTDDYVILRRASIKVLALASLNFNFLDILGTRVMQRIWIFSVDMV